MTSEKPWLHPKNDAVFKAIFWTYMHILAKFLLNIINLPEDELSEIKDVNTNQQIYADSKLTILDVKVVTKTGKIINVEIQLVLLPSFRNRIVFYECQMIVKQLKTGQPYSDLKQTICIVIVDKFMFPDDDLIHHKFHINEDTTGETFSDLLEIHVLELPKVLKKNKCDNKLELWLKFIGSEKKRTLCK